MATLTSALNTPTLMRRLRAIGFLLLVGALPRAPAATGQESPPSPTPPLKEGRRLLSRGQAEAALPFFLQALRSDSSQFDAHFGAGIALDLMGDYAEGRRHLLAALDLAADSSRDDALTAVAISFAFEGNPVEASGFYTQVFERNSAAGRFDVAATTATALGRIYLEEGDLEKADHWYRRGYATATAHGTLTPEQSALWEIRLHHALARIAARRSQFDLARSEAAAVHLILERGLTETERPQYHYLLGYLALYAGAYDSAIAELEQANQSDPFILGMIATAYERKGALDRAAEYYEKVIANPSHNVNSAVYRPRARAFLQRRVP